MQECGKKLRLALLIPLLGLTAGLAAPQSASMSANTSSGTTATPRSTTNGSRIGTGTPARNFLGTRSGATNLGTSTPVVSAGIRGSLSTGSSTASRTATPSLATPPTATSTGSTASARANGGLDCPTLAGTAAFADCDTRP